MTKIAVGKLGQKLLFNRQGAEAKRSNTNGNVSAYKTFKMMFELNPLNEYIIVGDTDYDEPGSEHWGNVSTLKKCNIRDEIDCGIFIPGIKGRDDYMVIIEFLNSTKIPWLMLTNDPRTTNQFDKELINKPKKILSQTKDNENEMYAPLQIVDIYGDELYNDTWHAERKGMLCIANETSDYDRVGMILEVTRNIKDATYAGRWSKYSHENYIGEVEYSKVIELERQALCSMIAPIKQGWVTSKYVELLANGVIPFTCYDYGKSVGLDFEEFDCTNHSSHYVAELIKNLSNSANYYYKSLYKLREKFGIYEATIGKPLNQIINEEVKKCLMK